MVRVLICDDDAGTRFLLKRILGRDYEAEVTEAVDGREALVLLEASRFDLLILDLMMPEIGGVETLKIIRSRPELADLPVVVLTSERRAQSIASVIQMGITDCLLKPLNLDATSSRLRAIAHRIADERRGVPS